MSDMLRAIAPDFLVIAPIFLVIVPTFLVIAAGFVAVRSGLLNTDMARTLGTFAITVAVPALLFRALATRSLGEVANLPYLVAYGAGSLAVLGLVWAIARWRGLSAADAVLQGMGASVSNSAHMGYPIITLLLGADALVALALAMIVENVVMLPLLLIALGLTEGNRQAGAAVFRRLLRNPLIIAMAAGLTCCLLGWLPPEPVMRATGLLADAAPGLSLFVIGATLASLRISRGLLGWLMPVTAAKLLLHPLLVWAVFLCLPPVPPVMMAAGVLFASMPMLSIYPIFAQRYDREEESTAALMAATLISFFSISFWAALLYF